MFIRILTDHTHTDAPAAPGFRSERSNQSASRHVVAVQDGAGREVLIALDDEARRAFSETLARREPSDLFRSRA